MWMKWDSSRYRISSRDSVRKRNLTTEIPLETGNNNQNTTSGRAREDKGKVKMADSKHRVSIRIEPITKIYWVIYCESLVLGQTRPLGRWFIAILILLTCSWVGCREEEMDPFVLCILWSGLQNHGNWVKVGKEFASRMRWIGLFFEWEEWNG